MVTRNKTKSGNFPAIFARLAPAKPTGVYETYWRFAAERQAIFFRRFKDEPPPWTKDLILQSYKFTNAYRASDRVSQYLIKNVIYQGEDTPEEVFFRIILFKIFNRIETWELLTDKIGGIRYAEFTFQRYDNVLTKALEMGKRIFSAAYIMPSGSTSFGFPKKHRNFLKLLDVMMKDEVPLRLTEKRRMRDAFELLRSYPLMGDFLAYQYIIDINYSTITNFSEMEFVIPGPGARDGIRKCFSSLGGLNEMNIIQLMAEQQHENFEHFELNFNSLWGRDLQLIDCQNLFCEVDKYSRIKHPEFCSITGRTKIKQKFRPNIFSIHYWYPPKWGINDHINKHTTLSNIRL